MFFSSHESLRSIRGVQGSSLAAWHSRAVPEGRNYISEKAKSKFVKRLYLVELLCLSCVPSWSRSALAWPSSGVNWCWCHTCDLCWCIECRRPELRVPIRLFWARLIKDGVRRHALNRLWFLWLYRISWTYAAILILRRIYSALDANYEKSFSPYNWDLYHNREIQTLNPNKLVRILYTSLIE